MQTLSAEELNDYADEYGLDAALAQRDYVAVRIAHAIASDPAVGGVIAVKGGFALRFGYGSPRTSKDIEGTVGTKHAALDPKRLQRTVRSRCSDLDISFHPKDPAFGADSLDFGDVGYAGPIGRGVLAVELSYREDLILDARHLTIDAFGVPAFNIRAIAINEMIAEKWRCLVQRSPKRPGDPYDLWFLWTDFAKRKPRTRDDVIDGAEVSRLVPQKVEIHDGWEVLVERLDQYKPVWAAAIGKTLPIDAPPFPEVRKAVLEAARAWTPWG